MNVMEQALLNATVIMTVKQAATEEAFGTRRKTVGVNAGNVMGLALFLAAMRGAKEFQYLMLTIKNALIAMGQVQLHRSD